MLTQESLRAALDYDPKTGIFRWRISPNGKCKIGTIAGSKDRYGYVLIRVLGKRYAASRLAFIWMTGAFPPADCDHRNGIPDDNRWDNLRCATTTQNMQNKRVQSNNRARLKGVTIHAPNQWRARIKVNDKQKHLGVFNCPAAAHFSYVVAADTHFGQFAHVS